MDQLLNKLSVDTVGAIGAGIITLILVCQHLMKNNNVLKTEAETRDYRKDLLVANKTLTERCDRFAEERNDLVVSHAREVSVYDRQIANLEWRVKQLQSSLRKCKCSANNVDQEYGL